MMETLEQRKIRQERDVLRAENDKLCGLMIDLIVFGSAAIDEEDAENREAAQTVLDAAVKQARAFLKSMGRI